jgi:hypothetical protein
LNTAVSEYGIDHKNIILLNTYGCTVLEKDSLSDKLLQNSGLLQFACTVMGDDSGIYIFDYIHDESSREWNINLRLKFPYTKIDYMSMYCPLNVYAEIQLLSDKKIIIINDHDLSEKDTSVTEADTSTSREKIAPGLFRDDEYTPPKPCDSSLYDLIADQGVEIVDPENPISPYSLLLLPLAIPFPIPITIGF